MGIFRTIRRIKWRNIMGLIVLMALIMFVVSAVTWLNHAIVGDCVEKSGIKVCFWTDEPAMGINGMNTINFRITNVADVTKPASVAMGVSPNLMNTTAIYYRVDAIAPGESIEKSFGVRAKGERGRFKVGFDIDADTHADKELYLTVE